MSRQNLYVLYDLQSETTIGQIVMANRDAAAVRVFTEILSTKDTLPGQYPQHFELRKVGSFDTEMAAITAAETTTQTIYTGKKWLADQSKLASDETASAIRLTQEAAT